MNERNLKKEKNESVDNERGNRRKRMNEKWNKGIKTEENKWRIEWNKVKMK